MRSFFLWASCIVIVWQAGCKQHEEEKEEEVKFLVTSPLNKDTTITRQYVCQIRSIQHIEIRALEKGYLQNIYVDEGQLVPKGKKMFQIMPLIYNAEKLKAAAEVNLVKIEYLNTQKLADSGVVSPNEAAMAKARLDKARAELALAQTHLEFTEIKAPFTGIMNYFQVRLGSLVNEGDLLTTLSDNSKMWVYFNVPEAEYLDYKTSSKSNSPLEVKLKMANNQAFDYSGVVETIEADFNNETGNIAFRATFPNPKALLRHGETGNVLVTAPLKKAILIPQKATFEVLEKRYVFVVDKNKVVHQREINISAEMPDLYVVKSGVSADEHILLEGIRKVKEGDKIHFDYEDPKSVISHLKVYVE